jgi:predicted small integral membrane protein
MTEALLSVNRPLSGGWAASMMLHCFRVAMVHPDRERPRQGATARQTGRADRLFLGLLEVGVGAGGVVGDVGRVEA